MIRISSLILLLGVGFELAVAEERVAADVVFAWKIQPLFKTKCLTCRGDDPKKLKGDLDMRSLMGLLKRGGGERLGRDHNKNAMAIWMAGGGVKAGHTIGATDEIVEHASEVVHPIRDLHVTFLWLMGLDDNKLTYFHGGRFKQLSQTGGELIKELIA